MKTRVKEMEDEAEQLRKIQEQVEEQMTGARPPVRRADARRPPCPLSSVATAAGGTEGEGEVATDEADSRSVCVQQVDYSATPEELQEFFAGCGTVNRVTILCGAPGCQRRRARLGQLSHAPEARRPARWPAPWASDVRASDVRAWRRRQGRAAQGLRVH